MDESYLKGNYTGGHVLFGDNIVDKKYVINKLEADIVKNVFDQCANVFLLKDIVTSLNEK